MNLFVGTWKGHKILADICKTSTFISVIVNTFVCLQETQTSCGFWLQSVCSHQLCLTQVRHALRLRLMLLICPEMSCITYCIHDNTLTCTYIYWYSLQNLSLSLHANLHNTVSSHCQEVISFSISFHFIALQEKCPFDHITTYTLASCTGGSSVEFHL